MDFKFYDAISRFRHDITIHELRLMNRDYSQSDITYNSLLYFDLISGHQGKYTASAIAELLHISKPAVIMKVNELMKQGLIYKEQSKTDKRVYYLFANEESFPLFKKFFDKHEAILLNLEKNYKSEEIDQFCEILGLIGQDYLL